ncbi:hypothetical protein ACFY2Z_34665 [Streptomyces sp. NPDC001222]|uniref:hypothetical protein n=1 Tax=Streptomyces sp. NPDC001222 TaxID=3364548 RepID=UPI0036C92F97
MSGNYGLWISVATGACVWVSALRSTVQQIRAQRGTRVTGALLMSHRERSPAGDGTSSTIWMGLVRFREPGTGVPHEKRVRLSGPGTPGSKVELCYPSGRPEKVRLFGGWTGWQFPVVGLVVGAGFALLPFFAG